MAIFGILFSYLLVCYYVYKPILSYLLRGFICVLYVMTYMFTISFISYFMTILSLKTEVCRILIG